MSSVEAEQGEGRPAGAQRTCITFFYNQIAAPLGLRVEWEARRLVDETGRELDWQAILIVDGIPSAEGRGKRLGHAKDAAARRYMINHGWIPPN